MADPQIFPGFQSVGEVPEALRAGLVIYTAGAWKSLQGSPERIVKWADVAGVTAGEWTAKIPIDFSLLDGFREDKGRDLDYSQLALTAVDVAGVPFYLAAEAPASLVRAGIPFTNFGDQGANAITQARRHKARMCGAVVKEGRPGGLALTYPQPGAANGLSLFNTAHYVNPLKPELGTFGNYYAAAGKFTATTLEETQLAMQMVPSPTGSQETLGLELTKIVGPSHMMPHFRRVANQTINLEVKQVGANTVAGGVSSVVTAGDSGWMWEVAPQLDNHPFLVAWKVANPGWVPADLPHMWVAISESIPGAHLIEMIAPSAAFTPRISILGLGSEHEIKHDKVAIIARMRAGASAGLPHVGAFYYELTP